MARCLRLMPSFRRLFFSHNEDLDLDLPALCVLPYTGPEEKCAALVVVFPVPYTRHHPSHE
eukprot:scaffold42145_cov221-Amphora_coffeaeformis.AAC.9